MDDVRHHHAVRRGGSKRQGADVSEAVREGPRRSRCERGEHRLVEVEANDVEPEGCQPLCNETGAHTCIDHEGILRQEQRDLIKHTVPQPVAEVLLPIMSSERERRQR